MQLAATRHGAQTAPLVVGPRDAALRLARTCYDHLAGQLGVALAEALPRMGAIELERRTGIDLTVDGKREGRSSRARTGARPSCTAPDHARVSAPGGVRRRSVMRKAFIGVIGAAVVLYACSSIAQTARDIRGPAAVVPLATEPPPRIVIDAPLAEWLAQGRVVIQYRTENLRIVPVFGPNALGVSPRIGHIHVTVDDSPWRWADASGEPLIINCLPPGPHKVLIELVNANHQTLEKGLINFVVPVRWRGC
jgi:Family of unknown function (DUF6130)